MKKFNGYILLVVSLSASQLMYDLCFYLVPFYQITSVIEVSVFLSTFGGISVVS
jgi:hypothetical protein